MTKNSVRRLAIALMTAPLILTAACGSDGVDSDGGDSAGGKVTIVSQNFTEAKVMAELYKELLDDAGFDASTKNLGTRDVYIKSLEKGDVQVSAEYLSSMTEELNRRKNGDDAAPVASPDKDATLETLTALAKDYGMTPLEPAEAEDANAYAVTKAYADANNLKTLSDLGKLGKPIKLAANSDCAERKDCKLGLESVYDISITGVEPLGFDSKETKTAVTKGEVQLGQVATTDATLDALGLVVLTDDKNWQNAENLVPVANTKWLAANPKAKTALDKLASALTTDDLKELISKVDDDREEADDVAKAFLKDKGLI